MRKIEGKFDIVKNSELDRQNKLLLATLRFYDSLLNLKRIFDDDNSVEYDIKFDIKF